MEEEGGRENGGRVLVVHSTILEKKLGPDSGSGLGPKHQSLGLGLVIGYFLKRLWA